ncbi:MAG: PLP-dependent aminotransferase family protein [Tissierellia bacterium]|nr:PLP-dependent aminotransferase family protein [Tissierellia bacterium]
MERFTINFNHDEFIYEQLYEYIKERILNKDLQADDKLPSKRKLSHYLNISENTVQNAYDQLSDEGYIYSIERSGFYVEKIQGLHRRSKSFVKEEFPKKEKSFLYDFSYHGIDPGFIDMDSYRRMMRKAMDRTDLLAHSGDPQGLFELRQEIKGYLFSSRGVNVSVEDIIISSGSEYLYSLLCRILPKNTLYGLENPGYHRTALYFDQYQLDSYPISMDESGICIDELIDKKIDCVTITPSHQFPTGIIYPVNRRIKLLKWAASNNSYIIEDDYDSEFRYSGKPIPALKSFDQEDRVVYMGSFSKCFSPALRISYMILPKKLKEIYDDIIQFNACPVPSITQYAFSLFMNEGYFNKHLNRMRTHYGKKRKLLVEALEQSGLNLQIQGMDSGLHFVCDFKDIQDEKAFVRSCREEGIRLYNLSHYIAGDKSHSSAKILIGYSIINMDHIIEGVQKITQIAQSFIQ